MDQVQKMHTKHLGCANRGGGKSQLFSAIAAAFSLLPLRQRRLAIAPTGVPFGAIVLLTFSSLATPALASPVSDALDLALLGQRYERSISLSTLGVLHAVKTFPADEVQEFYWRSSPSQSLDALSVAQPSQTPGSLRAFVNGQQTAAPAGASTKLGGLANNATTGAARVGFTSDGDLQKICEHPVPGDSRAIEASTHLSFYRDGSNDGAGAASGPEPWYSAIQGMPDTVHVLVAAAPLQPASFETGWRLGISLMQTGRDIAIRTFPTAGEAVDTTGLVVPDALAAVPAFAALRTADSRHVLANHAEVGALLVLDAPQLLADVVVLDDALRAQLNAALDALMATVNDEDARASLANWRAQHVPSAQTPTTKPLLAQQAFGARKAWVATPQTAESLSASGVAPTNAAWTLLYASANGAALATDRQQAGPIAKSAGTEGKTQQFTVQAPYNWGANFALQAGANAQRVPDFVNVQFKLPDAVRNQGPVGVVHWNGILLAAQQLKASNGINTIRTRVPVYALGAVNVLTVSMKLNAAVETCVGAGNFPITALTLDAAADPGAVPEQRTAPAGFDEIAPRLAGKAQVAIPTQYLQRPRMGLGNAIRLAAAGNISPWHSALVVIKDGTRFSPTAPYLALNVDVRDETRAIDQSNKQLLVGGRPVQGPGWTNSSPASVMQLSQTQNEFGLRWYPLGDETPVDRTGLLINHGRMALLGLAGNVAWLNASGNEFHTTEQEKVGPMYEWRSLFSWGAPLAGLLLGMLVLLTVSAGIANRLRRRKENHGEAP